MYLVWLLGKSFTFCAVEGKKMLLSKENPVNQPVPLCGRADCGFREKNKWVLNKHQCVDTSFPHWLVVEAKLEVCGHNPIKQENNHVDCVTKFLNWDRKQLLVHLFPHL